METILGDVDPDGDGEVDDVAVMTLLESMTEVKNEYQNLRKDIQEVQQLQREMTNSLICQRRKMVQTFRILKKKIEMRTISNWVYIPLSSFWFVQMACRLFAPYAFCC